MKYILNYVFNANMKQKFISVLKHQSFLFAKPHNSHKSYGTRRSKLEKWIEIQLLVSYQSLIIKFNKIDDIGSELDIFIPSLKLAFEINGIFHYKPIYGQEKLTRIKNNDKKKLQNCLENGIDLYQINVSDQIQFKEEFSMKYLDIIRRIINHYQSFSQLEIKSC